MTGQECQHLFGSRMPSATSPAKHGPSREDSDSHKPITNILLSGIWWWDLGEDPKDTASRSSREARSKREKDRRGLRETGLMICVICGEEGIFEITSTTVTKIYRKSQCQTCRRIQRQIHQNLKRVHTIPAEACQCCGCERRKLVLDHCHTTGIFRGWLCQRCNTAIGMLGDTEEALRKALTYLVRSHNN